MKIILVILFLLALPAYSQNSISLSGGIDLYRTNLSTINVDYISLFWKPGITLGVTGEYFVSPLLAVSPSFEYVYYRFDSYYDRGAMFPEFRLRSSAGGASHVWQSSAVLRLYTDKNGVIRFYLATGIGYLIEQLGEIRTTYSYLNGADFTDVIRFENRDYFVHILGAGIRWNALSRLALEVKGHWFSNYTDRMYTTIRIGTLYSFPE